MQELLKEGLTVAFSSFAGASLALLRERFTARLEKRKRDYSSLREAHFALLQQYTLLTSLRDQFLTAAMQSPVPWLTMLPIVGFFDAPRLDVPKLVYMLESPEPDLLNRLLVAQQKYFALHAYFEQRNSAHEQLQDRLASLQRDGSLTPDATVDDIERLAGHALVGRLKTLTDAISSTYPGVLTFQEGQLSDLQAFSKRVFPKRRVPKFELLPEDQRR